MHIHRFFRILPIIISFFFVGTVFAVQPSSSLNTVIDGRIATGGEVDVYTFSASADERVTISAYLGFNRTLGWLNDGGRIALKDPSGTIVAAPVVEIHGNCANGCHYSMRVDDVVLLDSGMYSVEVWHSSKNGIGRYTLGISNPHPEAEELSKTAQTDSAYPVRGALQEWSFVLDAEETVGWAYGARSQSASMQSWKIVNEQDVVVASGNGGVRSTIIFTPSAAGTYRLRFSGAYSTITSSEDVGPHAYSLHPFAEATLGVEMNATTSHRHEKKLLRFEGGERDILSIDIYFGHNRGLGIGDGLARLYDQHGVILQELTKEYIGNCADMCHAYAHLRDYNVPLDGVYILEVEGYATPGVFTYHIDQEGTYVSLTERYSPILHIFAEDFQPKVINSLLNESELITSSGVIDTPSVFDLADPVRSSSDYLDLLHAGPLIGAPDSEYFAGYDTTVYVREIRDTPTTSDGTHLPLLSSNTEYIVLQYWFFYPYNAWLNEHEGDWEMVQLIIDQETEEPLYMTFSSHYAGETYAWSDLPVAPTENHPHVYVASGGHGSWASPGIHAMGNVFHVLHPDSTPGDGEGVVLTSAEYDLRDILEGDRSSDGDWNSFVGRWGAEFFEGTSGPRSPSQIVYEDAPQRFVHPIAWANTPVPRGWAATNDHYVLMSVKDQQGKRTGRTLSDAIETEADGTYMFLAGNGDHDATVLLTEEELEFRLDGKKNGRFDFLLSCWGIPGCDSPQSLEASSNLSAREIAFRNVKVHLPFTAFVRTGNPDDMIMVIDDNGDGRIDRFVGQGEYPTLKAMIKALPRKAFHRSADRATKTLFYARLKVIEQALSRGNANSAISQYEQLKRLVEQFLVSGEVQSGRPTKEELLKAIDVRIDVLKE